MLSLEPTYRNLWVVLLLSSHHKQIKIDPQTTVPPNPNIGRVALHRSAEHRGGARLWLLLCSFSSWRRPWRKYVKRVKTSVSLRAGGLNPSVFISSIDACWDCGRLRKFRCDKSLDGFGQVHLLGLIVSLPRVLSHFLPHPHANYMQMCIHPVVEALPMLASFVTRKQLERI